MTEEQLQTIEDMATEKYHVESRSVLELIREFRRLQTTLEQTENLLYRAVIDSNAMEMGRQEERRRILAVLTNLQNEEDSRRKNRRMTDEISRNRWHAYQDALGTLYHQAFHEQPVLSVSIPPEALRARIRELEDALRPLADAWENTDHGPVESDVYAKAHELLHKERT